MVNIKKIHDRMKELQITKAQLIKDSGLTRVTIDKVLAGGNINVETVEALAKGLGVNVGFFFDDNISAEGQNQIGGSHNRLASHDFAPKESRAEHDELIRLREEVKYLKLALSEKDERIAQLAKINEYLMDKK